MTTTASFSRVSASLLSAVDAIRNVRALLLMFATLVAGALVWGLAGVALQGSILLGLLLCLVGAAVLFYGVNAVGLLLMDQAKGVESRAIAAALAQSLATSHRLLLLLLLVAGAYLVGLLVLLALLLICKIPLLGPLLFAVVFPLSVVLSGVALFALFAVVLPLAAPSIWDGAGALQAVSRLLAIARSRLVPVLISMALLFFIAGAVTLFVFAIMAWGSAITGTLSAAVLGGGMSDLFSGFGGGAGLLGGLASLSGGGYLVAASIGGGVVYAMALSLPSLIYGRGCCQVYLSNIETIEAEGLDVPLRQRVAATQQHVAAALVVPALTCPHCNAPVRADDSFCGNCGGKTV